MRLGMVWLSYGSGDIGKSRRLKPSLAKRKTHGWEELWAKLKCLDIINQVIEYQYNCKSEKGYTRSESIK